MGSLLVSTGSTLYDALIAVGIILILAYFSNYFVDWLFKTGRLTDSREGKK